MPYEKVSVTIPNVSGNIAITVQTSSKTRPYTNLADPTSQDWMDGYRINSSKSAVEASGKFIANAIPCVEGDVVRIRGIANPASADNMYAIKADQTESNVLTTFFARTENGAASYDAATKTLTWTAYRTNSGGSHDPDYANLRSFRSSFQYASGYTASDIVITVNEEIT